MVVNYVYNDKGIAEYVVIPTIVWTSVQEYINKNNITFDLPSKPVEKKFNPREFKGLLSPLNLDIEQEILNMRSAWKRISIQNCY